MRERTVESYFTRRALAAGCTVRKVKWVGRRDCPDRVLMTPYAVSRKSGLAALFGMALPATVWVELKRPGEKPRGSQLREHQRMRDAGQCVVVLDSIPAVDNFFDGNFA